MEYIVNGAIISPTTSSLSGISLPFLSRTINYVGESNWSGDSFFHGIIDELVIYDYIID